MKGLRLRIGRLSIFAWSTRRFRAKPEIEIDPGDDWDFLLWYWLWFYGNFGWRRPEQVKA